MDLQTLLDQRQITKYHLSKVSGVPKTTIMDICAGRSEIERCSAKTVRQLAKALDCTMEDIMELSSPYDSATGLPKDKSYHESSMEEIRWRRTVSSLGLRLLQSSDGYQQRRGQPDHQSGAGMVSAGEVFKTGKGVKEWAS